MSYLVLARKWRPQNFEEVIGQQPVVRTLQNALERDRVPHALIFSGVRGVGKTTLARIMAKALNCQAGPVRTPCNRCESCRGITAGTAIDLHEIDGASNRGIQEIRELKENILFFPTTGRFKIIIIDEVHMLTTEAFNALLKTLEEPPAHVFFMFATTEPHKVPITILSRCQRYELKRVTAHELAVHFRKIAEREQVVISDWAINMIVREAAGSVRDGLSLLDQVFSFAGLGPDGAGIEVRDDDLTQVLELVDTRILAALAGALLAGDLGRCLELLDEAYVGGIDLNRFSADLLAFFRALLVCKVSGRPAALLDLADQELASLQEMAAAASAETLYNYFNLLLKSIDELRYSSQPRLTLEMAFIRLVQAGNIVPVSTLLAKIDGLLRDEKPLAAKVAAPELSPAEGGNRARAAAMPTARCAPGPDLPKAGGAEPDSPDSPAGPPVPTKAPGGQEVRQHWPDFINYVMARKKWMAHTLKLGAGVREEGRLLTLKFDEATDCKMLQTPENMKLLAEFAQDFFQKELQVVIKIRGASGTDQDQDQRAPREERRALANDPLVQMTTEIFDGQVVGIRTANKE